MHGAYAPTVLRTHPPCPTYWPPCRRALSSPPSFTTLPWCACGTELTRALRCQRPRCISTYNCLVSLALAAVVPGSALAASCNAQLIFSRCLVPHPPPAHPPHDTPACPINHSPVMNQLCRFINLINCRCCCRGVREPRGCCAVPAVRQAARRLPQRGGWAGM